MKKQTSSFSWARVAQLYRYNAPWIRKQTTIYFLFSLATALLYFFIPSETGRTTVYGTCGTVLQLMFIWAPIVFTQGGDTRIIDRLIPASIPEKFAFYMSYLLIVIAMACFFCPWVAERIFQRLYPGEGGMAETIRTTLDVPKYIASSQYLSTIAAMITCFYCVVAVRRDRIMKAYLISICVLFLMSSLNSFYGIKESIVLVCSDAFVNARRVDEFEMADKVYAAMSDHLVFLSFCMAVSIGYVLILMWLSFRSLYRRNL